MPLTNSTSPTGAISARAVLAVHRAAFEKDGGDDVVPAADVGQQLRQQVTRRAAACPRNDGAGR